MKSFLNLILILFTIFFNLKTLKCDQIIVDSDTPNDTINPVNFEIVGDTSHLLSEEVFEKKEVQLLHNLTDFKSIENQTNSSSDLTNQKRNSSENSHPECLKLNKTSSTEANRVKLVNGSRLTKILSESLTNECFLVLFYVPWCPFSANLAPIYNALPKAFTNLEILAFDVSKSIGYNTKFGTSAVPMIILFQNKNVISKFNYTHKNLTDYIEFISNKTGFLPNEYVTITEADLEGPVPTEAVKSFDYYLLISWLFLIFVTFDFLWRKTLLRIYFKRLIRNILFYMRPINTNRLNEQIRLQAIENVPHPHND